MSEENIWETPSNNDLWVLNVDETTVLARGIVTDKKAEYQIINFTDFTNSRTIPANDPTITNGHPVASEAGVVDLANGEPGYALITPCDMKHQEPYDFAYCETHDRTFALGEVCEWSKHKYVYDKLYADADQQRSRAVLALMELERIKYAQQEVQKAQQESQEEVEK